VHVNKVVVLAANFNLGPFFSTAAILRAAWNLTKELVARDKVHAFVIASTTSAYPGSDGHNRDITISQSELDVVTIPVLAASYNDVMAIQQNNNTRVVLYIEPNEANPWGVYQRPEGIFFAVVVVIIAALALVASTYSLVAMIRVKGCKTNVATVCIILHLISAVSTPRCLPFDCLLALSKLVVVVVVVVKVV